jgi:hypothetical protein
MLTAIRRRRGAWAIAASILAHLGVLTVVLLQHPTLVIPVEPSGPPEAIIPILILPRTPPPAAGQGAKPTPIQLHRRQLRNLPAETPVAPVVIAPPKPAEAPPQAPAPPAPKEAPTPPPPSNAVRATLRTTLGCNDLKLPGLSREDRTACLERLGRGARDAPYLAQPLSAEKRAALDQAGAAKLANRARLEAPMGAPGPPQPSDYDGDPYVSGAGATIFGPVTHPPSKRAAPKLGPLPP